MHPSSPIQILLVDDAPAFVRVLAQRLAQRGMQVTSACDGPTALACMQADDAIEVVVLDMAMPGMDGLETLAGIRRLRPLAEILMLTGHATLASAVAALQQGAFDYLMKPCDIDLLLDRIASAAARRRRRVAQIRDVLSTPYISGRKRRERIDEILSGP